MAIPQKVFRYRLQSLRTPYVLADHMYRVNATLRDWDDKVDIAISFSSKYKVVDIGTLSVRMEIPETTP